jgi:hypothetical protein
MSVGYFSTTIARCAKRLFSAARNPYEILGIQRSADLTEIKKAYIAVFPIFISSLLKSITPTHQRNQMRHRDSLRYKTHMRYIYFENARHCPILAKNKNLTISEVKTLILPAPLVISSMEIRLAMTCFQIYLKNIAVHFLQMNSMNFNSAVMLMYIFPDSDSLI